MTLVLLSRTAFRQGYLGLERPPTGGTGPVTSDTGPCHLACISHHVARRSGREGRQDETRAAWRAQAYLNRTLSTASKRNEVLAVVSRASTVGW